MQSLNMKYRNNKYSVQKMSNSKCITNFKNNIITYPQQHPNDCAVFTMKCADWLCDGMVRDYTTNDMNYFRKRILVDVIRGMEQSND